MKFDLNKVLVLAGIVAALFFVAFLVWWRHDIEISGNDEIIAGENNLSLITGTPCEKKDQRPLAVMMPSDPVTRPLSGISQADIVFEMPVTPNGITRYMAVFQCDLPSEIGSIRSAREDFIPLAASLDAIYAHWGGEHDALTKLNGGIINNLDALVNKGNAYFRKSGIAAPHNGFTSVDRLISAATSLQYSLINTFSGYPHGVKEIPKNITNVVNTVEIPYPYPLDVKWTYDAATNYYTRVRGGRTEIDKNNSAVVKASSIVVMKTSFSLAGGQYINVRVTGEGDAKIYQNGITIAGKWKKDPTNLKSKLYFYDLNGKEIEFVPGKIWVEIVAL